jgi:tRNA (adenine22-N1)-methyltransferase
MLSARLLTIANLIPKDSNVADIGCDHGYLLIYLMDNGFKGKLLGVDNKIGPLNAFKQNLQEKHYEKSISFALSDGLDAIDSTYNTIVLAGMGYNTIEKIVLNNVEKLDFIDNIIIDSHTKEKESREFFVKLGYKIEKEILLEENGIYYTIIFFKKGQDNYTDDELYFGPILLKEKPEKFYKKWSKILSNCIKLIDKIDDKKRKKELQKEVELISKVVN